MYLYSGHQVQSAAIAQRGGLEHFRAQFVPSSLLSFLEKKNENKLKRKRSTQYPQPPQRPHSSLPPLRRLDRAQEYGQIYGPVEWDG